MDSDIQNPPPQEDILPVPDAQAESGPSSGRRRSTRVCSSILKEIEEQKVEQLVISGNLADGIEAFHTGSEIGWAVRSTQQLQQNQFICEYAGELITREEANRRTEYRRENGLRGDYIYHFRHPTTGENMCIDATEETESLGRLINHSLKTPNLTSKFKQFKDNVPRILFYAMRTIEENEELKFDYGERNRDSIEANPWLKH